MVGNIVKHLRTLGLSAGATLVEVKAAFRRCFVDTCVALCGCVAVRCAVARLQLRHHPDKGGSKETCQELNAAMDFFLSVPIVLAVAW